MKGMGFVIALMAIFAPLSFAQNFTGTITGTAKDQSGAVLPGVQVTALNPATGLSRPVISNERGDFVIPLLPVGTYEVRAELPGFRTEVRQGIVLQVDQRLTVNINLQVGEVSERLVVTESAPLLQSETSDVGGVIENKRVVELPLNGRQFENLALLVPGTFTPAPGSSNGYRGGISIAGSRERYTGFSLDGIDMVDTVVHIVNFRPSVDAIQEFKVQTNRYSAELGRTSGGQVTVTTKSGTNEMHGTVYEFVRNNIFDAKNFFDPPKDPIPGFKRNNFGGTIGGPIRRDRTFIFANYEGLRLRQALTRTATTPSVAMVAGDFSALATPIVDPRTGQRFPGNIIPQNRIDPIGQAIARFYPKPNSSSPTRNFVSTPSDRRRIDQFTIRVDHRFSNSNNFFARYTYNDDSEFDPFDAFSGITNLPGYGLLDDQFGGSISTVDTHVFSPTLVAEFRLGYNRYSEFRVQEAYKENIPAKLGIKGTTTNPTDFGYPTVLVTGFDTIGKTNTPTNRHDNAYQGVASLTSTHGNHTLKIGNDVEWFQSSRMNNGSTRGIFNFSGQYSGNAIADLVLGYPRQTQRSLGDSTQPHFSWVFSHYLQDDWKVSPRFTLNLGVRYDWQTPGLATMDRLSSFNPQTRTIEIAGKAGVLRDISRPDNYYPELAQLAQTVKMIDLGRRNIHTLDHNDFAPRLGMAVRMLDKDRLVLRTGYGIYYNMTLLDAAGWKNYPFFVSQTFNANATQPNISIGDPFPGSLATSTLSPDVIPPHDATTYVQQYNLGFQYQASPNVVVDIGYVGNKGSKLPESRNLNQPLPSLIGSVASRRPYQGFGNINQAENTGNSHFDSLQLRVERNYAQGLTLLGSYTWSKSIDYSSAGASGGDSGTQDQYHIRESSRGVSGFDARHRLVVSYVYELPFGSGQRFLSSARGIGNWFVSGWEVTGISTMQSGRPFTVRVRADNSNTGASGSDRPNLVGNPNLPRDQRSPDRWFNTTAFAIPARGTFGNVGRNTLVGPPLNNMDFSLMKNSRIRERKNVQFRAEFFNLLNHPNFDLPNRDADSPQFGQIFTAQFPRQIQLGLKLIY